MGVSGSFWGALAGGFGGSGRGAWWREDVLYEGSQCSAGRWFWVTSGNLVAEGLQKTKRNKGVSHSSFEL